MNRLDSMTASELLAIYNKVTGESVKRFADRASGLRRVQKLDQSKVLEALNLAATSVTVVDDGKPLPSLEQALQDGADERARAEGRPGLDTPVAKPKRTRKAAAPASGEGPAELKKLLTIRPSKAKAKAKPAAKKAKAAATPQTLIRPIEGSKLVAAGGRVVRPENAQAVLAGKSIWGGVGDAPADKDKLKGDNARLNLNYPAKKVIKPMREGTKRHKLVVQMRGKGVTVEDVMAMFQLTHDQAVYKLRDLHYMCGHGLEMKNGRVFVLDR